MSQITCLLSSNSSTPIPWQLQVIQYQFSNEPEKVAQVLRRLGICNTLSLSTIAKEYTWRWPRFSLERIEQELASRPNLPVYLPLWAHKEICSFLDLQCLHRLRLCSYLYNIQVVAITRLGVIAQMETFFLRERSLLSELPEESSSLNYKIISAEEQFIDILCNADPKNFRLFFRWLARKEPSLGWAKYHALKAIFKKPELSERISGDLITTVLFPMSKDFSGRRGIGFDFDQDPVFISYEDERDLEEDLTRVLDYKVIDLLLEKRMQELPPKVVQALLTGLVQEASPDKFCALLHLVLSHYSRVHGVKAKNELIRGIYPRNGIIAWAGTVVTSVYFTSPTVWYNMLTLFKEFRCNGLIYVEALKMIFLSEISPEDRIQCFEIALKQLNEMIVEGGIQSVIQTRSCMKILHWLGEALAKEGRNLSRAFSCLRDSFAAHESPLLSDKGVSSRDLDARIHMVCAIAIESLYSPTPELARELYNHVSIPSPGCPYDPPLALAIMLSRHALAQTCEFRDLGARIQMARAGVAEHLYKELPELAIGFNQHALDLLHGRGRLPGND